MAEPQAWPFLVVLMSTAAGAESKSGPDEPRVRGLGWIVGDRVVTLPHVADRADTAVTALDDVGIPVERLDAHERFSVLRAHGDATAGRAASLGRLTPGASCSVAIVSDDVPRVRLAAGQAQKPGPDGRFTVVLDQPLRDYETASGSPVVSPDGTVFGIVGPTAASGSVDAYVLDELEALIARAPAASFELAGGISRDLVDPTEGIPLDRDDLGVRDYVTMFATVIADRATPMPLSFGLFGEWGSGKSYFMGLLREQVATLARSGEERYCGEIVQIGFNAWHYSDSNLWASLGDEIFERLAGSGETDATRRRRLRKELGKKLQRRKELKEAASSARAEVTRLTRELDEASINRSASTREFVTAVLGSPTFRSDLDEAWRRIGVKETEEKVRLLAGELGETPADLSTLNRAVGGRRRWLLFAGLVAAVAVVVAGAVASRAWLAGSGVVVLAAVVAVADRAIARVRSGVRLLHEVAGNLRTQQAEGTEKARKQLRQAEANEELVRVQLTEMTAQAADIGRELAELTPGQRLYNFIAERAAGETYRSQLGLISTIRKDFLELTRLMKAWQESETRTSGRKAPRPVDRIVLYIDDLDRCSPQQVVDVLQAVHLLLALELFVVVVGVDPRWLLRALRRQYRTMLTTGSRPASQDPQWEVTTPQDYLEKIFNIPFALPRMSPTSFERLVRSVVAVAEPPADRQNGSAQGQAAGDGGSELAGPAPAAATEIPVEEGSEVAALQSPGTAPPDVRPITEGELRMLAALAPLIGTPRETKRLLNLYRMIRSTRNLSPASQFLGDEHTPGEHEAVVILLGLLSGHGRLLENVLAAPPSNGVKGGLRFRGRNERWADFVAGIQPRRPRSVWRNAVVGTIEDSDLGDWRRLADGLAETSTLVTIPDLAPFQLWAPRIARFSFLLSPFAQEETAVSTEPHEATRATPVP